MGNSLQEQLLKAGLVTERQARDTRQTQRKDRKAGKPRDDADQRAAAKRRQEQAERDRALNDKKEAERRERELRVQIRDMVLAASLNQDNAEVAYNVLHGSKVRRIYVTPEQRDGLVAGTLAVATARGRHHVIPAAVGEKIAAIMPGYFVHSAPAADAGEADGGDDDPYARYKVPDDLMW
jgi:hypothetical protein